MKNCVYILLIFAIFIVACSKSEEPTPTKQSELNKNIVGVDETIHKYYYSEWSQDEEYALGYGILSCVVEYEIIGCPKVAVSTINTYPFDICKEGTTIIVNDISRYTEDIQNGDKYRPLHLDEVEILYEDKKNLYIGDSLPSQNVISWKHIDKSLYELKFTNNTSSKIQKIRLSVGCTDPENLTPADSLICYPTGFNLYFQQLTK